MTPRHYLTAPKARQSFKRAGVVQVDFRGFSPFFCPVLELEG